ncbi:MAG TPA: ABC transporter ATP-binding protein [Candidatus Binatia bacterium]|nr:ABC transporter ATP-binding protein [Candidatus Binatia bacterium]
MNALAARGVGVRYGARVALRAVDASVAPGEVVGVIGPNGSGKSTLVRVLAGVRAPDEGAVALDGRPLDAVPSRERARTIALVPQETHVAFPMTVRDLVLLGRAPHTGRFGWEHAGDLRAADDAMVRTDTRALAGRMLDEISGGERQRVVLARALAQEPRILLLDEPTAFLDLRHAVLLLDLVRDLCRERDLAVVLVVHDLNLAAMYCDRLVLLSKGEVHATGAPAEVLSYARLCEVYETELYVAPNDVTGQTVVLPLSREHRARLGR